jgi:hypothetical protein
MAELPEGKLGKKRFIWIQYNIKDMERTKGKKIEKTNAQQLHALASELMGRNSLALMLGMSYNGDRDLYQALGYPLKLEFSDFAARYIRQDIAKAIIDRPVKATWQGPLELVEPDISEDTEFEDTWENLNRTLGIKSRLSRLDRLTGIGRYGVLLLGLNDVKSKEAFANPVASSTNKLLYLKPFGEKSAKIKTWVVEPKDERFSKPLLYTIEIADVASGSSSFVDVHYSRVLHIIQDPLESEVYGTPVLEALFNRLMDLEKIVGGDAEMFWRGARPGFEGKVDPEYQMTEQMKEDLKDQVTEYENNLRRILINEGVDLKALAQQIADPTTHVDAQLTMISALTGIPKRVLSGSERGELSSAQDSSEWKDYVQSRREDYAEPVIVRVFVDRLIELGILPTPAENYVVKWNDLYSLSEKAKVEIGKGRANALREYTYNPIAQEIIPPKVFYQEFLGFTKEQITLTESMRDSMISEEELNKTIIESVNPPKPVIPAGKPIPKKKPVKTA